MKKGLIALAIMLVAILTVSVLTPAFAAYEMDCVVLSGASADVGIGWAGEGATVEAKGLFIGYNAGSVEYDEATKSVKFYGAGNANEAGGFYVQFFAAVDGTYDVKHSDYPYMAFCYKTENANDGLYVQQGEGGLGSAAPAGQVNEFTKVVGSSPDSYIISQDLGVNLNMKCVDYAAGVKDTVVYFQYIAFFKTEADANAFDYDAWLNGGETSEPEASEPEASEPEASEPETSEPEVSEPEASEVENSESEKPNTNTSDVAMISGAILLCAAAAVAVTVSRKRK
ncbi:MAG: hypothetical protein J5874_04735 [Oscillospiraceae bacterium]|nr:hypothetical protein [Oscillospiraceae bacterium]